MGSIINYVANSTIAILGWEMDTKDAIRIGHFIHRNGSTMEFEKEEATTKFAEAPTGKGHEANLPDINSGVDAILIRDGQLIGAAELRCEGVDLGQ